MRNVDQKGYTIVEMMIVVVIIGILVSIAVPNYTSVLSRARRSACLANQRAIEMTRMYNFLSSYSYGTSMADLSQAFNEIGFVGDSDESSLVCPDEGSYTFVINSYEVTCSIAEHNN